jgi:hypothetical protein
MFFRLSINGKRPQDIRNVTRALEARMGVSLKRKTKAAATATLNRANAIFRTAIDNCPIDTGNLVRSGYLIWTSGVKGLPEPDLSIPDFAPQNRKYPIVEDYDSVMAANHRAAVYAAAERVNRQTGLKYFRFRVAIGFSAYYALWVHEGHGGFASAPATKFLESAVAEHENSRGTVVEFYGDVGPGIPDQYEDAGGFEE